jgi:hypothetical protein
MPNLGLPGAPAEADEGGGARAMADGAHPARSDPDLPDDPRGRGRALASTAVDSEAAGPHTVESRRRANWPAQGNATEPRRFGARFRVGVRGGRGTTAAHGQGHVQGQLACTKATDQAWSKPQSLDEPRSEGGGCGLDGKPLWEEAVASPGMSGA